MQPQFGGFQDRLATFELWRGKKSESPEFYGDNYTGTFKVSFAKSIHNSRFDKGQSRTEFCLVFLSRY